MSISAIAAIDSASTPLTAKSVDGHAVNGQWIGRYSGTNSGLIVADFDEERTGYSGVVFAYDDNPSFPRTFAFVNLPKDHDRFSATAPLQHVERGTGNLVTPETVAARFPGVAVPTQAEVEWQITPQKLVLNWKTNIGTNGVGEMTKSEVESPSTLQPLANVTSWAEFKAFVLTLEHWRFAFRGHENSKWRLRTSFHRTGRASLTKFSTQDVPALHRHLSGMTTHHFNLADAQDYAAFMNLVQHHGYPTPLLDWTQSPFVAAYFAFKDLRSSDNNLNKKVRVLVFDAKDWHVSHERAPLLMPGYLHLTVLEPLSTNNPRVVPQQSISTVTNVDDIEHYIRLIEEREKKSYLRAIDIPVSERQTVLHELALMGITAGSLFPGLEGACRQLRERFFELY